MKCTICGKEHTGGVTITLLDATWYYCSSICAFKSGHSDPVKEAMINFFAIKHEDAKNTEQQLQLDSRINRLPDNQENAIKNILNDKIKIEKEVAIKSLGETESSTVSTFMGVNIKEFTKEELIKILSLQQRKWLESIGFKYEE